FKLSSLGYFVYGFFNQRFLIEFFYNNYIINVVLNLGGQTTKVLDKGSIEKLGPHGFYTMLVKSSKIISNLSKGVVTDYALYIVISTTFFISLFVFTSLHFDIANIIVMSSILIMIG